jgi:hypothetical protein
VEFLEHDLPTREIGLTFVYCDHKLNLSQRVQHFIAAIVRQLVEREKAVPKYVQTLYQIHRGKGTAPTRSEFLDLLQLLSTECSELYVVIDALDECIDKDGEMIWKDLLTNLKKCVANLRLLYTSRHIDDIDEALPGVTCIEIRASDADMRAYIQAQVKSKSVLSKFRHQDPSLQDEILQTVVLKAEGM